MTSTSTCSPGAVAIRAARTGGPAATANGRPAAASTARRSAASRLAASWPRRSIVVSGHGPAGSITWGPAGDPGVQDLVPLDEVVQALPQRGGVQVAGQQDRRGTSW